LGCQKGKNQLKSLLKKNFASRMKKTVKRVFNFSREKNWVSNFNQSSNVLWRQKEHWDWNCELRPVIRIIALPNLIWFFSAWQKLRKYADTYILEYVYNFVLSLLVLVLQTVIDSYFHGSLYISSLNFLLYNVYYNVGDHYGTHPFHWYLTQGFPIMLLSHILPFLFGLSAKPILPLFCLAFNVFIYR
jgi:hypothetical protein